MISDMIISNNNLLPFTIHFKVTQTDKEYVANYYQSNTQFTALVTGKIIEYALRSIINILK